MEKNWRAMTENNKEVLDIYKKRLKRSDDQYRELYKKIKNSRDAFNQKMPADIINQASNTGLVKGNENDTDGNSNGMYENCSRMLIPMYTAIVSKTVENLTALPPRYEWDANKRGFEPVCRKLERELVKVYTKMNLSNVLPRMYKHFIEAGFFVQQTVFKKVGDKVRKFENSKMKIETVANEKAGAIDFYVYDPLTTFVDWDAQPGRS